MKQSSEFKESLGRFEKLFNAVVSIPKAEVEKEEAKERLKNRIKRKKAAKSKRASTSSPRQRP